MPFQTVLKHLFEKAPSINLYIAYLQDINSIAISLYLQLIIT